MRRHNWSGTKLERDSGLMQQSTRKVAVIGGARIPFCRSNTIYADLCNLDMLTAALSAGSSAESIVTCTRLTSGPERRSAARAAASM